MAAISAQAGALMGRGTVLALVQNGYGGVEDAARVLGGGSIERA